MVQTANNEPTPFTWTANPDKTIAAVKCGHQVEVDLTLNGVSVVICCFNSVDRLPATLSALARCSATFPVEIIVVDNNSNDGTGSSVEALWKEIGNPAFNCRIVAEPHPGSAFAKRAGVHAAKYDVIVFCDDDNQFAHDYLERAMEIMRDPTVGAAGGQCEPVITGTVPTFIYSHGAGFALGVQALQSGDVTEERGYLWGAGLTIRRGDLLSLYACPSFPVLCGRSGPALNARGRF